MINHPKALLCVEHIEKYYGNQGSVTKALNQVSFLCAAWGICEYHGGVWFRKNYLAKLYIYH